MPNLQIRQQRPFFIDDIPAPFSESFNAAFDSTPTLGRESLDYVDREYLSGGEVLTKQQIDDRIGDLPLTVEEGVTSEYLDSLIASKRKEIRNQSIISRAERDLSTGIGLFTAGLAASLTDPAELGVSAIPFFGQARYAKTLANTVSLLGRMGVRAKMGVASGMTGAAIVEPFIYSFMQAKQADYSAYDSMMSIVYGGILGGGLHATGGAIKDGFMRADPNIPSARIIDNMSPETQNVALKTAVNQFSEGKHINVSSILESDPYYSYYRMRVTKVADPIVESPLKLVNDLLTKEIDRLESTIPDLEKSRLSRGDVKELQGRLKNLDASIEKSKKEIEGRSANDLVRKGHENRLKQAVKERDTVLEKLSTNDKFVDDRKNTLREVEDLKNFRDTEDAVDVVDFPPKVKEIMDSVLQGEHKRLSLTKLNKAMNDSYAMKQHDSYSIYPSLRELESVKKEVQQRSSKPDDELIETLNDDVMVEVDRMKKELGMDEEVKEVEASFRDQDNDVKELDNAINDWLNCRSING